MMVTSSAVLLVMMILCASDVSMSRPINLQLSLFCLAMKPSLVRKLAHHIWASMSTLNAVIKQLNNHGRTSFGDLGLSTLTLAHEAGTLVFVDELNH